MSIADYDVGRSRHLKAFPPRLRAASEWLTAPLARRHALRDQRLRQLLRVAKERSSWHARRLRHVDPDTVTGADLSMIPAMTKADLMANWDAIVTDPRLTLDLAQTHLRRVREQGPAYLLDDYHVVASTGSSGSRGVFAWSFDAWMEGWLAVVTGLPWLVSHGLLSGNDRTASIGATDPTHFTPAMHRTFAGSLALESIAAFDIRQPVEDIVDGLNRFQPALVFTYASMLNQLALEARTGRLRIRPEAFFCASEPTPPAVRRAVAEAFDAPIIEYYGASEVGTIAQSLPGRPGLHIWEENGVYEPVDADHRAMPAGSTAKLLLTNVVNPLLPLIRYELADRVTFVEGPNPGPWTGRLIESVPGRMEEVFLYDGGVRVHAYTFESVLENVAGLLDFQVRQTSRGADVVLRTTQPVALEPLERELRRSLGDLGLRDPDLLLTLVDAIGRTGSSAKQHRFVPLRPA